eukprot:1630737-Prymnesium_polylepis.2
MSITSSGIRRYLMLLPRMITSGNRQKRSPSRDVQMTSLRLRSAVRAASEMRRRRRARGGACYRTSGRPRSSAPLGAPRGTPMSRTCHARDCLVAAHQVAVVSLTVLELDELRRRGDHRAAQARPAHQARACCANFARRRRTIGWPTAVRSSESGSIFERAEAGSNGTHTDHPAVSGAPGRQVLGERTPLVRRAALTSARACPDA